MQILQRTELEPNTQMPRTRLNFGTPIWAEI